ncbi:J domain-containing protein [Aspergillus ibericus CBS 121593]|uniref:DnaJ domain protein n=1 Tax=Aspergillus ibericus CBS 121593 TaxID=1448316 RepID=A0A395H4T4_9EURO|nr:DnaJ domain protein [Aspergillus ibericus CBS 121593]RAL01898.1 DnaJ domain protein [Aspergillus ibericus CBS 121593]
MNNNNTPPREDTLSSTEEELDYYAILNLPRHPPPTESQIRSAYRTLTLSFHPDKQPAELTESAIWYFSRIQAAYDTLIDPKKRMVYDMMGAEGVRREWAAKDMRVGVKAMSGDEFRSWFLERMKKKERSLVEDLVDATGSFTVGIDVTDAVHVDDEGEITSFRTPSLKLSAFSLGYSFRAPMPTMELLFGKKEREDEDEGGDEASKPFMHDEEDDMELVFNAGIAGRVSRPRRNVAFEQLDGTLEERSVLLPHILATDQFNLGVSATRAFRGFCYPKGILAKPQFSFLQDSTVVVKASVLPHPSLETSWAKPVIAIPGTKPFRVELSASLDRSLQQVLPSLGLNISRPIADRKVMFCDWSTGTLFWPQAVRQFFQPLIHLGLQPESLFSVPFPESHFQVGVVSEPENQLVGWDDDEDEDEEEEFKTVRRKQRKQSKAAEFWQAVIVASPVQTALSFSYSRNIFSGQAASERVRSEWSSEGHYPLTADNEPRSVRVKIETTVGQDMSLGWYIEGTRNIGGLSRMGLGVGVRDVQGLVMTVSWSRLGQSIRVPISLLPFDVVDADLAALAVICPWLAYCALEFGFIRPRERKKQRRVIARRQKQLRKLVPKKRAESQAAIELMAEQVQRRQAKEARQDGLIITRAEYGHYPLKKDKGGVGEPQVTDVSIPVAALVDHGQLSISKNMVKSHIIGFHDPAPLLPKTLKIWYNYHGKEHYVEADDAEGIACPMRAHLL